MPTAPPWGNQGTFAHPFCDAVSRIAPELYWKSLFVVFSVQRCPEVVILGTFLTTFSRLGAYARTVLWLQRELDLGGSGRSGNRHFFDVFFRPRKKAIPEGPFMIFLGFRRPQGAHRPPKCFPVWVPRRQKIATGTTEGGPVAFGGHPGCICSRLR